jgi:hypothetical protein
MCAISGVHYFLRQICPTIQNDKFIERIFANDIGLLQADTIICNKYNEL